MKINPTSIAIIKNDLKVNNIPALMGEPGIGKSSLVGSLARAMNSKHFVVMCNQMADKGDLTGARLMPTPDGSSYEQRFFPHHKVREAVEYALANPRDWVLLLLDEINRTTPDVTSAALTLATERELGDVKLPENLKIIVAGNDKGNVNSLDSASLSRFVIYHIEPCAQTLMDYFGDDLNPWVRKTLTEHPELVFEKSKPTVFAVDGDDDDDDDTTQTTFEDLADAGDEMLQLTTPRTIEAISRWLNTVETTMLQELVATSVTREGRETTMLNEVLEGHLGNTDFTTFLMGNIVDSLASSPTGHTAGPQVPKPNCYTSLKSVSTVDEMAKQIAQLNDNEKGGALVYAIYEKEDNKILIEQLLLGMSTMPAEHNRKLIQLASNSQIDMQNLDVLRSSSDGVGKEISQLLQHIID